MYMHVTNSFQQPNIFLLMTISNASIDTLLISTFGLSLLTKIIDVSLVTLAFDYLAKLAATGKVICHTRACGK